MSKNKNQSAANNSNEQIDNNTDYEASKLISLINASSSANKMNVVGNDNLLLVQKPFILSKEIDAHNQILNESIDSNENDNESSSDDSVGFFNFYYTIS